MGAVEGLLSACEMYRNEMTLIDLMPMNGAVHHPCVVMMWRRVNNQSGCVPGANMRNNLVRKCYYWNKTEERWLGKRPHRIHVRRDENVFSVPF